MVVCGRGSWYNWENEQENRKDDKSRGGSLEGIRADVHGAWRGSGIGRGG